MSDPSVTNPQWDVEHDGPPWYGRFAKVGTHAGSERLGATVYEMDAGGAVSPYHLHHANEELLIVLSGRPLLRTPSGFRRLEPGAVVAFPVGPDGAHRISNPGPGSARVLIVSTAVLPDVAEHLDTGTVMALTDPGGGKTFPAGSDVAFAGVYMEAMERAGDAERGAGFERPSGRERPDGDAGSAPGA